MATAVSLVGELEKKECRLTISYSDDFLYKGSINDGLLRKFFPKWAANARSAKNWKNLGYSGS